MDLQEAAIALDFLNSRVAIDYPYYFCIDAIECLDIIIFNGYDISPIATLKSAYRLENYNHWTFC